MKRGAAGLFVLVGVGVGIAVAVNAAGVHASRVVSYSMSPTIHRGDWIVTHDLSERDRDSVRRRDIVLFRFPLGTSGRAVKRVVAIGGDRVAIDRRRVVVNGHVIPVAGAPGEGAGRRRVETMPSRHVFLLGDNAAISIDSRSLGPVPDRELVGRVLFVIHRRTLLWLVAVAAFIAILTVGLFARRVRRGTRKGTRYG
jgi:signal peptidase I